MQTSMSHRTCRHVRGFPTTLNFRSELTEDHEFRNRNESPHGPAAVRAPKPRAAIDLHLADIDPGNGTIEITDVSADRADFSRTCAAGIRIVRRAIKNRAGLAMRREGLAVAGGP